MSLRHWFHFLHIYSQKWNCWIIWFYFSPSEKPSYCFPQWLHQFTFPATVPKGSLCSTPSSILVISCLFDNSPSNRCEEKAHCGFDLHFPDGYWCGTPFHVPVGHLYTFFWKMSTQMLRCTFFSIELYEFSHPSTNQARPCLASEIRRDRACSGWYGCRLNCMSSLYIHCMLT